MADNTNERRTITIAEVDQKKTGKDQANPRLGIKDTEGHWYGVFDAALWPRLTVGSALNVAVRRSGQFLNITGVLGKAPGGAAEGAETTERIARAVALKAAVDLLAQCGEAVAADPTERAAVAIVVAEELLRWLQAEREDEADAVPF